VDSTTIPQFERRHRLRLALEAADITPDQMAEALGCHKNTVYNWMAGDRSPKLGMVKEWARVCQVPWEWIETGALPEAITPDNLGRIRCFRSALALT
jgi:transcriptional regulator with XRE-family HTH domain